MKQQNILYFRNYSNLSNWLLCQLKYEHFAVLVFDIPIIFWIYKYITYNLAYIIWQISLFTTTLNHNLTISHFYHASSVVPLCWLTVKTYNWCLLYHAALFILMFILCACKPTRWLLSSYGILCNYLRLQQSFVSLFGQIYKEWGYY